MDAVEAVTRELGVALGATEVSFLIADLSGRALVRLSHIPLGDAVHPGVPANAATPASSRRCVPFDGGPAEQAVRTQTVQVLAPADPQRAEKSATWTILAPMTERGEALGLAECGPPPNRTPTRGEGGPARAVLARGDREPAAHRLVRVGAAQPAVSLSAEIQRGCCRDPARARPAPSPWPAWLEPAADDRRRTFTYSLARDLLHLSITDAPGHGVDAAHGDPVRGQPAQSPRYGASLREQASTTNAALPENSGENGGDASPPR